MKNKTVRIFNFKQANYLFQNGCKIQNCGYSDRDGAPYIRFIADELFQKKMRDWQNRK